MSYCYRLAFINAAQVIIKIRQNVTGRALAAFQQLKITILSTGINNESDIILTLTLSSTKINNLIGIILTQINKLDISSVGIVNLNCIILTLEVKSTSINN